MRLGDRQSETDAGGPGSVPMALPSFDGTRESRNLLHSTSAGRFGGKSVRKPWVQIPGSAPVPLRSAAIESRDPAAHWDAQKRPDTSAKLTTNGSREGRQELSMSNVEDARSRLGAHRVSRIVSFAIFALGCARRYHHVGGWSDQYRSACDQKLRRPPCIDRAPPRAGETRTRRPV